jgi:hypothetical protein
MEPLRLRAGEAPLALVQPAPFTPFSWFSEDSWRDFAVFIALGWYATECQTTKHLNQKFLPH